MSEQDGSIVLEVTHEEIVEDSNCETVTIEVTNVKEDGTAEFKVLPKLASKRSASKSPDNFVTKRLAVNPAANKSGAKLESDVIISLQPEQVVDGEGDELDPSDDLDASSSQVFKCFLCGTANFKKWSDLLSHFMDEHCSTLGVITTCMCPHCGFILTLTQEGGIDDFDSLVLNALSHVVREHGYADDNITTMTRKIDQGRDGKVSCDKCGATVRADYMKKHLAHYCKGCKRVFDCKCGRQILPGNIPTHANVCAFLRTEKACTCPDCGLIFKTVHNMELHFRRCHLKESRYSCELCGEKFFKRDVLVQHNYVTHNINMDSREILYCTEPNCDFTAVYAYSLNQHTKRLHEKGPFTCERCDKVCNTYYSLNRHRCIFRELRGRRVTSHITPSETDKPNYCKFVKPASGRLYKCSECNFTNESRKRVELHGRIHNDSILETEVGRIQEGAVTSSGKDLLEGPEDLLYCCSECGSTSRDENLLRRHIELAHPPDPPTKNETQTKFEGNGEVSYIDTSLLPHQDAEAISLLNHFKMGHAVVSQYSNEGAIPSNTIVIQSSEDQSVISEVVQEPVSYVEDVIVTTEASEDLTAPMAIKEEVITSPSDYSQVPINPFIIPNKEEGTAIARSSPRLFHELTREGMVGTQQKGVAAATPTPGSSKPLQEYNIVFQNNDHPTPPGQVILLSQEEAAQLMIQQSAEVHIDQ